MEFFFQYPEIKIVFGALVIEKCLDILLPDEYLKGVFANRWRRLILIIITICFFVMTVRAIQQSDLLSNAQNIPSSNNSNIKDDYPYELFKYLYPEAAFNDTDIKSELPSPPTFTVSPMTQTFEISSTVTSTTTLDITSIETLTTVPTYTPQPAETLPIPTATNTLHPEEPPSQTPTAVSTQPPPANTATPQPSATPTAVSPTQTPTTAPSATSTAVATNTPTLPPPTSTATPTPTATNTPLPSPTNTPTTAGYCPASAGNGRYIINFNNQMIRSDWSEADAQLGPLPTNLSPGTYRISLVSYDPDHALADAAQQPAEKWYLLLQDAENSTIFMSAPTGDLADDQLQQTFVVADEVFIAEGAAFGVAYHAAYPDGSSPNSVYPVCGILEQLAADATPTPMPSATSELLITPNPTVITPHD